MTGCDVLSDFRQRKLLQSLQSVVPDCRSLTAHYLYFVDVSAPLNERQQKTLAQLLEVSPIVGDDEAEDGDTHGATSGETSVS